MSTRKASVGRVQARHRLGSWLLALAVVWGCADEVPSARSDEGPAPAIDDTSFRFGPAERIVAIGDLHGDVSATRAALRLAGALGTDDHWVGGALVVVQTGDQLDRGDDEPEVLDLLERLSVEAAEAGGALHALNGNHEVMNVQGDFRFVTPDGFRDYAKTEADGVTSDVPPEQRGRASAFQPGGVVAKQLAKRRAIVQIGENVFVHGGLFRKHVRYGIGRINREIQEWMEGASLRGAPDVATSRDGPLWLRAYSDGTPWLGACAELEVVLEWLAATRLVVGHTLQEQGINDACNSRLWRIDVGLTRYYGNPPSVLEITGDTTRVIEEPPP
jgi:hypothetical protein